MRARKERRVRDRVKLRKAKAPQGLPTGSALPSHAGSGESPPPLFVFNVKLFDDRLLPPVFSSPSNWPHRYVVVTRRPDGTTRGDGPLRTRLEADATASRVRLDHAGARVHLVVALDETEQTLDAFFADADSVRIVAEEGARARERYEEWRRKAGPTRPAHIARIAGSRRELSPAFT